MDSSFIPLNLGYSTPDMISSGANRRKFQSGSISKFGNNKKRFSGRPRTIINDSVSINEYLHPFIMMDPWVPLRKYLNKDTNEETSYSVPDNSVGSK